jgi:hypothetical protein
VLLCSTEPAAPPPGGQLGAVRMIAERSSFLGGVSGCVDGGGGGGKVGGVILLLCNHALLATPGPILHRSLWGWGWGWDLLSPT